MAGINFNKNYTLIAKALAMDKNATIYEQMVIRGKDMDFSLTVAGRQYVEYLHDKGKQFTMEDWLLVPTFAVPGGFAAKATSGSITGTGGALRPIINSINAVTYSNHTDSHAPFYRSLMDAIRDFPAKIVALENAFRLGKIN